MGFIRRRGDAWQARYRAPNGRERSKSFRRKLDAQRWLATQTADLARGDWIDPALGRMTFAEWVPRWQATLIDLRPNSLDRHLMVVRVHLLPRFGRVQLAKIRRSDVQRMIAEDMATGYASSTVRRHVIVLRSVLEAAVQDGRVKRNVARGVRLPPESTRPMLFLDPSEVVAVATSIRPQFYGPLVWTAAYVGLRWGELAGLQLDRIDLLRGTVTIDTQMTEVRGRLELGPPKSKAGFRQVQLPAAIVELLGPHLNSRQCRSSGLAFPTVNGYPLRRGNFRKIWRRTIDGDEKRSGVFAGTELEGLVFHELRHTAAALAIGHGAHPLTIKERLGHSSITVTMDTYGHLFPAQDQALADALDGTLRASVAEALRTSARTDSAEIVRLPWSAAREADGS